MKKIVLVFSFLFSVFFIGNVSALNIDFTDNQVYRPSQGIVILGDLSMKIENNGEITKDKGFSLIIPDEAKFRFSSEQNLSFSGTGENKILSGILVNSAMTSLTFKVSDDFKLGDNFSISGLKLVIYDRQSTQNIGIDINYDNTADFYTTYYVRINDVLSYHDDLAPSEVFNLTGTLNGTTLTLNGDIPGDIDFQAFQIYTYDISGNKGRDYFTFNLKNYSIDVTNISSINIKTVDYRANYSTGLTYSINYFKAAILVSTDLTNTGALVLNGANSQTGEIILDKVVPIFKTKSLTDFMLAFDNILDKRGYKKEVRIIRNKIIQLLKDYEDRKVTKIFVIKELKKYIVDLKKFL